MNPAGKIIAAPAPANETTSDDVALHDVAELFCAVKERLRGIVSKGYAAACLPAPADPAEHVRAGVLECVAALDQLHGTLTHEIERRQRLEGTVAEARAALAHANIELIGSCTGATQARHRSMHESLTSLPNGGFFRGHLDHALGRARALDAGIERSLAVLCLDLDGFKPINDTHGHDAGDALLRVVAARLARAVRHGEVVGHLGGDEFACLLPGAPDRAALVRTARSLLEIVSEPVDIGALRLSVRPSIGIAVCPDHGATSEMLLRSADAAMYRAKRDKCGYAFFDERVDTWSQPRL